jgi:hypothetical protein
MQDAPLDLPDADDFACCSSCGKPAHECRLRELNRDTFACSDLCEQELTAQYCVRCGANEAEGEMHSERCDDVYAAERKAAS